MRTPKDIAWLAGLLEGEGSFLLHKTTKAVQVIQIELGMTDEDIMQRAASILGAKLLGPYVRSNGNKVYWKCFLYSYKAAGWMMTLYQFMGNRRKKKIKELLHFWRQTPQPHQVKVRLGDRVPTTDMSGIHRRKYGCDLYGSMPIRWTE